MVVTAVDIQSWKRRHLGLKQCFKQKQPLVGEKGCSYQEDGLKEMRKHAKYLSGEDRVPLGVDGPMCRSVSGREYGR